MVKIIIPDNKYDTSKGFGMEPHVVEILNVWKTVNGWGWSQFVMNDSMCFSLRDHLESVLRNSTFLT